MTGVAILNANTSYAECSNITYVKTNFDNYSTSITANSSYPCALSPYVNNACQYYTSTNTLIASTYCECSLKVGATTGFCPFPG